MKDAAEILVSMQDYGYTFAILPSSRQYILEQVPHACPADRLSLGYQRFPKVDFPAYYASIEAHALLAIMGVKSMEELKPLRKISFKESVTDVILHQINFENE
jgi:hypothetical protein